MLRSCDRNSQVPKRPRTQAHRTHVSIFDSHAHRTRASVRARVRVRIFFRNSQFEFKCGGSIINNHWILSAGHCFCEQLKCKPTKKENLKIDYKPEDHIRIVTGLKDLALFQKDKHRRYTPDKIIIHPL